MRRIIEGAGAADKRSIRKAPVRPCSLPNGGGRLANPLSHLTHSVAHRGRGVVVGEMGSRAPPPLPPRGEGTVWPPGGCLTGRGRGGRRRRRRWWRRGWQG